MLNRAAVFFTLGVLFLGWSSSAGAQCTLSQLQNSHAGLPDTGTDGLKVGQSFVACGNGTLQSLTTALAGVPRTVTFRLYEGAGYGGTEIASKAGIVFDTLNADVLIDLTVGIFGSTDLVGGATYTFSLETTGTPGNGADVLWIRHQGWATDDPFPGGVAYGMAGTPYAFQDLYFVMNPDPLPFERDSFSVE